MKNLNNQKKAVIFDLDGTLFDSKKVYYVATEQIFGDLDKEFSFELGRSLERFGVTKSAAVLDISREKIKLWLSSWVENQEEYTSLFCSAPSLLKNLSKSGYICGINTNRPQTTEEIRYSLKKYRIDNLIQIVQTSLSTGVYKPDPKGINLILSELQIAPEQCFYVGDSFVDILAGKKAGVNTIAVTTGVFSREELEFYKPNYIIDDLSLVEKIVNNV